MSKGRFKRWTLREIAYLRENYSTRSIRQMAADLGVTVDQVKGAIVRNKIKSGKDTRFQKGHVTWNAGKPVRLSPKSEFKKGNLPHNTKYDGAISERKDSSGRRYLFIRVSMGKWVPLHRHIWEQIFGPIPKGMIIVFKDKNTTNLDVSNLEMINRKQSAIRNINREKAAVTMREVWRIDKLRTAYGMDPKTKLINRPYRRQEVTNG